MRSLSVQLVLVVVLAALLEPSAAQRTRNCYKQLGVATDADEAAIKRGFRKLARKYHPDKVPAEEKERAEEKFKQLVQCYEILSDEEARRRYDASGYDLNFEQRQSATSSPDFDFASFFANMFGGEGGGGGGGGGNGGPSFASFSSGPGFGGAGGGAKFSSFPGGGGGARAGGARHARPQPAPPSKKHTVWVNVADLFEDSQQRVRVPGRAGAREKVVTVTVPAGAPEGHVVHEHGMAFEVKTRRQGAFTRGERARRADLHTTVPVTLAEALLGVDVELDTPGGEHVAVHLDRVAPGQAHVVKRKGLPRFQSRRGRGHLVLDFEVVLPELDAAQRRELRRLAEGWRYPKTGSTA